jgi:hypothetical protein
VRSSAGWRRTRPDRSSGTSSGTCWHPYVKLYANGQQHLQWNANGRCVARQIAGSVARWSVMFGYGVVLST